MGDKGFKYETKMAVLIALRLYKKSDEFYLSRNWQEGEKFDDLVYSAVVNGKWETCFIQLKHRKKMTINLNTLFNDEAFRISKYFESFRNICQKFKKNGNGVIFSKSFDDSKFLIYSNAPISNDILELQHEKMVFELLATNPEKSVNIKFRNPKDLFPHKANSKIFTEFMDKFFICGNHANEADLEHLIKRELENFPEINRDVTFSAPKLYEDIEKMLEIKEFLTKFDLNYLISQIYLTIECNKENYLDLSFTPAFMNHTYNKMFEYLSSHRVMLLLNDADNCNIFLSLLNKCNFYIERNIAINILKLENNLIRDAICQKWSSNEMILILNCDGNPFDRIFKVWNFIQYLISINATNKVLLVASARTNTNGINALRVFVNVTMLELEECSRQKIADKNVIFQGCETKISNIMNLQKMTLNPITQLVNDNPITIGETLTGPISYYVQRELTRKAVSSAIFSDPQINACFALSGISLEDANSNLSKFHMPYKFINVINSRIISNERIIILAENPQKQYEELAKISKNPIYWFEKGKKGYKTWYLRNSTNGIDDIRRHAKGNPEIIPIENAMELLPKFVIVSSEPGMGKTTYLDFLAIEIKSKNPNYWVLKIVLNDISDYLSGNSIENKDTLQILKDLAGLNENSTYFEMEVFETCYEFGNIVVLLDGFDEISPYYTENGMALISALKNSPVSRVWITTRIAMENKLEDLTATLSYKIKPFNEKEQDQFLKQYWKERLNNQKSSADIDKFTQYVLEHVKKCFDEKLSKFTGIPLQTRMIAEVFFPHLQDFLNGEPLTKINRLNIVQLFQDFVQIKLDVQREKSKVSNNAAALILQEQANKIEEENLLFFGLLTIFQLKICQKLDPKISKEKAETLKEMVDTCTEKTGLVVSFKSGIPKFIHRTFAEYFVALYFTKNFSTNRNFLIENLFTERLEFVRYFLDRIFAAGYPLHEALLSDDIEEVTKQIDATLVNKKDKAGRTPLHIAASMPNPQLAIKQLLSAGADVTIKDDIFNWKPMDYAIQMGVLENIESILEKSQDALDNNLIELSWKSLLEIVQKDYLNLFILFFKNDTENCYELSEQKWINDQIQKGLNILHLAAAYESMKIMEYLLEKADLKLLEKRNSDGLTPLLFAGSLGKLKALERLIHGNANLLATSPDGKSLLQVVLERKGSKKQKYIDDFSFRDAYLKIISQLLQ